MKTRHLAFTLAAIIGAAAMLTSHSAPAQPAPGKVTLTSIVPDGKPHTLELKNKSFLIDGQPTLIIAGEMHFGRILPEDFETRVKQAKAMGLNTISFYLFWNLVEPVEGKFDFTGMNDVRRMLKICQDNGMWVVLRPGPYCCAEVDYGGIPSWTLKGDNVKVKIRTTDPKYMEWSRNYINAVAKEVADFQSTRGGPLLMVQVENEYGMAVKNAGGYDYPVALKKVFRDAGFTVPLFVCDPGSFSPKAAGPSPYGDDILRGRNGLNGEAAYQQALAAAGDFPVYAPEVYTAWFSAWGQPTATKNAPLKAITDWTTFLLDHNTSWCYYLVFGGTNYGYNTGCNEHLPLITSYDYNAPIDEAGRTTEKFRALRQILATRTGRMLPEPPAEPAVITLPEIRFKPIQTLSSTVGDKPTLTSAKPAAMEDLDQPFGFVLYRKTFPNGIKGKLELRDARDYAITTVNKKQVGESFVGVPGSNIINLDGSASLTIDGSPTVLDILVQNLGRISVIVDSTSPSRARKGLIGGVFLDGKELTDWSIYSLPLTNGPISLETDVPLHEAALPPGEHIPPTFYASTFTLEKPASTYLDLRNWSMGVVWVNGHNLGRYWDRGAIRSLLLPAAFLKAGQNDITILELNEAPKNPTVAGTTHFLETAPVPFPIKLDTPVLALPKP